MRHQKLNLRQEYRRRENLLINASQSLSERFADLKNLTVHLAYFTPEGGKTSEIKYTVNLACAKSLFRFVCSNHECVCGDFDLSNVLALAVEKHQGVAVGEAVCQGWRSKETVNQVRCLSVLRYRLSLRF